MAQGGWLPPATWPAATATAPTRSSAAQGDVHFRRRERLPGRGAFVAPREPDAPAAADAELAGFLAGRLARYKLPRRYELLVELPRTGAGKVNRADLRRRAAEMTSASSSPSAPGVPPPPAVAQPEASDSSSSPGPARRLVLVAVAARRVRLGTRVRLGRAGVGLRRPPLPVRPKNFSAR